MLTVRPITDSDIPLVTDYWMNADEAFLRGMGADIKKVPPREQWEAMLHEQVQTPVPLKRSDCIVWLLDDTPVGHSNASDIIF